jgi:hypothetical protein
MIRFSATASVLLGSAFIVTAAPACQQDECKACQADYQACTQAHTKDACKTNRDICLKHCRKKFVADLSAAAPLHAGLLGRGAAFR